MLVADVEGVVGGFDIEAVVGIDLDSKNIIEGTRNIVNKYSMLHVS
jgi:hypothetical protein